MLIPCALAGCRTLHAAESAVVPVAGPTGNVGLATPGDLADCIAFYAVMPNLCPRYSGLGRPDSPERERFLEGQKQALRRAFGEAIAFEWRMEVPFDNPITGGISEFIAPEKRASHTWNDGTWLPYVRNPADRWGLRRVWGYFPKLTQGALPSSSDEGIIAAKARHFAPWAEQSKPPDIDDDRTKYLGALVRPTFLGAPWSFRVTGLASKPDGPWEAVWTLGTPAPWKLPKVLERMWGHEIRAGVILTDVSKYSKWREIIASHCSYWYAVRIRNGWLDPTWQTVGGDAPAVSIADLGYISESVVGGRIVLTVGLRRPFYPGAVVPMLTNRRSPLSNEGLALLYDGRPVRAEWHYGSSDAPDLTSATAVVPLVDGTHSVSVTKGGRLETTAFIVQEEAGRRKAISEALAKYRHGIENGLPDEVRQALGPGHASDVGKEAVPGSNGAVAHWVAGGVARQGILAVRPSYALARFIGRAAGPDGKIEIIYVDLDLQDGHWCVSRLTPSKHKL